MHCIQSPAFAAPMKLPSEIAFTLGSTDIYWTGILFAVAILSAILLVYFEAKRKRLPQDTPVDLCLVMIPMGLVGARVWHVIANMDAYTDGALTMLRFWDGGLSVYGASLFALLGLFVYALKKKLPFPRLLDTLSPGIAFAQAILIWGDFFSQKGYGVEIHDPSLMWFPLCVLLKRTDTVHLAVFFYEFLLCLFVFIFLWLYLRKKNLRDGTVFLWYLLLIGLGHAVFNAMRTNCTPFAGPFDVVGCICLVLGIGAGVLLILFNGGKLPADKIDLSNHAEVSHAHEFAQAETPSDTAILQAETQPEETSNMPNEPTDNLDVSNTGSDD